MAGYKANRNTNHVQHKRYWRGMEVKPTRYYNGNTHGVMAGSVDGELVRDATGRVIPYKNI